MMELKAAVNLHGSLVKPARASRLHLTAKLNMRWWASANTAECGAAAARQTDSYCRWTDPFIHAVPIGASLERL